VSDSDLIVVSIKPSAGYDSALIVFKGATGEQVQTAISDFFGYDIEAESKRTPYQTFLQAQELAKSSPSALPKRGKAKAAAASGAPEGVTDEQAVKNVEEGLGGEKVEGDTEPAEEGPSEQEVLIQKIGGVTTKADLGRLWRDNKILWQEPAVAQAAEAKSKDLS
jgi:hypothetical protein